MAFKDRFLIFQILIIEALRRYFLVWPTKKVAKKRLREIHNSNCELSFLKNK
jgi:hypothetical protein